MNVGRKIELKNKFPIILFLVKGFRGGGVRLCFLLSFQHHSGVEQKEMNGLVAALVLKA